MAYQATILPVMIASPGDVSEERGIVREVLVRLEAAEVARYASERLCLGERVKRGSESEFKD